MAIGERIHFFRLLRGMTQKYLGTIVGFPERSADVRLAHRHLMFPLMLLMSPTLTAISD